IGAALALIGAAAAALYRLLNVALGASFSTSVVLDLTHALAVVAVSSAVAVYHWRIIRADSARGAPDTVEPSATEATVHIEAADAATLARALEALRATGVRVSVHQ